MKIKIFSLLLSSFLLLSSGLSSNKQYTLPEVIEIGLKNNPQILALLQDVEAKKATFQASKSLLNPEIDYQRGRGKSYESEEKINTEEFSITQSLENPFKRSYRIRTFEKKWAAAQCLLDSSRLEYTYQIKKIFYKAILSRNKEELVLKNLNSLKEIYQLILRRVKLGEAKELEAVKLKVETLKAQNELNKVQTELELAKEELNKLLGNSLPPDFSLLGELTSKSVPLAEKPLLEKALISHPLIRKKEKEWEAAQSNLSYIRWQRFPDFELSGFSNKEIDGQNKGIGISLEIPLWNFKTKEIAVAQSLALKQEEELKALRMELRTEIKIKLNQLRLSEQTIELFLTGLLKEAEESLKIAEFSYKQGEISLINYLDSQRTYYSILKDYQDSLYEWNINKASLEKSIGEEIQ